MSNRSEIEGSRKCRTARTKKSFPFQNLESLQRDIEALKRQHADSLRHYHNSSLCGFWHRYREKDQKDFSKASSATCVLSLVAAGLWTKEEPWFAKTRMLARRMLDTKGWTSAGLPKE